MYRIIKTDGTELGVTDSIRYIKINTNSTYINATKDDAVGIAYKSKAYNLIGHEEITDADTVVISETDASFIFEQYVTYDALAKAYNEGVQNA